MKPIGNAITQIAFELVNRRLLDATGKAANALLDGGKPETYAAMAKGYHDAMKDTETRSMFNLTPAHDAKGRAMVAMLQAADEYLRASIAFAEATVRADLAMEPAKPKKDDPPKDGDAK